MYGLKQFRENWKQNDLFSAVVQDGKETVKQYKMSMRSTLQVSRDIAVLTSAGAAAVYVLGAWLDSAISGAPMLQSLLYSDAPVALQKAIGLCSIPVFGAAWKDVARMEQEPKHVVSELAYDPDRKVVPGYELRLAQAKFDAIENRAYDIN